MVQFQAAFLHLINGEKYYNNLVFINLKYISKLNAHYEPASSLLEQIAKQNTYGRIIGNPVSKTSSYDTISISSQTQQPVQDQTPIDDILGFIDQCIQFIELRNQLMKL
jgi:hypothetical protein